MLLTQLILALVIGLWIVFGMILFLSVAVLAWRVWRSLRTETEATQAIAGIALVQSMVALGIHIVRDVTQHREQRAKQVEKVREERSHTELSHKITELEQQLAELRNQEKCQ